MKVLVLSDNNIYGDAIDTMMRDGLEWAVVRVVESIGAAFVEMETDPKDVLLFDVRVEGVLPSIPAVKFRWPQSYMVAFGVEEARADRGRRRLLVDKAFYRHARAGDLLQALMEWHGRGRPPPVVPSPAAEPGTTQPLSSREHQVATLLVHGMSNKEIARSLDIEVATVKNHVHSVLRKMKARTRLEAATRLGVPGRPPRDAS